MSLFQSLAACIKQGEKISFTLGCDADGQYSVLIQPHLNWPESSSFNHEQMQIRVGLAQTLMIEGDAATIDENLVANLASLADGRQQLHQAKSDLEALAESVRQGRQAVHKQASKKTANGETQASSPPTANTDEKTANTQPLAQDNPTSLF